MQKGFLGVLLPFLGAVALAASQGTWLGFLGVPLEDFPLVRGLGARTVEYRGGWPPQGLDEAYRRARGLGLDLLLRGPGRSAFLAPGGEMDPQAVGRLLEAGLGGRPWADEGGLLGLYWVDEPCHEGKFSWMGRDLARLHQVFHAFRPSLRLVVNFGRLECLERMRRESGGAPVADVALFTVTAKKVRQEPGYLEGQAALARRARAGQAGLEVVPMVAVWGGDGVPLPDPGWVWGAVEALRGTGAFDGLLFYPWTRPPWAEQGIKDVLPAYEEVFRRAFSP